MESVEIMKTIMVTGGAGFIGSHLVEKLLNTNAQIVIPYIEIVPKSYFSLIPSSKKIILEKVDIKNRKKIALLIKKYNINYIFHLAAQTLVTEAYKSPFETLETNVMGTVSILEGARLSTSIKGVIIASSDKAYGKTNKPYVENFPLAGEQPYDVSKSSADLISQTYYKTYGLPVVITRFGNVYGEGDLHFDRIIPGICESIIKKKPLKLRSDGTFVRDYLYVKDVVEGYIVLFKNLEKVSGQAFNFSSKDNLSVIKLIRNAEKILNLKIPYEIVGDGKNEIPYQHLNDTKVQKLGWKSAYSLEKKIPEVLLWYKNYFQS